MPGAVQGIQPEDPTLAELLKPLGYLTAQINKNHLGDRTEFLSTVHGFDAFYGNLYHLNAEEEPEQPDYPDDHPGWNSSSRAGCWTAGRQTSTIPGRTRRSVGSASKPSRTPAPEPQADGDR